MKTRIHGHRGARGRRPENTLAAVEYALRHAVDGVEVDVCVTSDDAIVLHHDLRLNSAIARDAKGRWVNERTPIRDLSLREIRRYDVGRLLPGSRYAAAFAEQTPLDGVRIPTLDECVALMRQHVESGHGHESGRGAILDVELKSDPNQPKLTPDPDRYVALLLEQIERLQFSQPQQIFLQSFDWRLTRLLKQRRRDLQVGFTSARPLAPAEMESVKSQGADALSCNHLGLTEQAIRQAHDLGLAVHAWTVNQSRDVEKLAGWGVDVIVTDHPDWCRALLYGDPP